MSNDPLAEWRAEINSRDALITDPEGQTAKLVGLAMLASRRRQVSLEELNEMLELCDAARLWALSEWEEAEHLGIFTSEPFDSDEEMGILRVRK